MKKILTLSTFLLVINVTWAAEDQPCTMVNEQTECPICLDALNNGEEIEVTNCDPRHNKVHKTCMDSWRESQPNKCPICRAKVNTEENQAAPQNSQDNGWRNWMNPRNNAQAQRFPEVAAAIDQARLRSAAETGNLAGITRAIQAGVNLNTQHFHGKSALIIATEQGHVEVVRALLEAGANIHLKDMMRRTALDYALASGNEELISLLLARLTHDAFEGLVR